jgi:glyoxylase-like metal-dependent hydrolase (beta-lactamase superfamily II)
LIVKGAGEVVPGFHVIGTSWSPVFLLDGPRPAFFEGGVAFASRLYLDSIGPVLDGRAPEWIFLTHVHWDHCGAVGALRAAYPSCRIGASRRAAEIMRRPKAVRLMAELNDEAKKSVAEVPEVDPTAIDDLRFEPFEVDETLEDGRVIPLAPDLSVRVIATPGHTKDHLSYFIPERGILICSEASGSLDAMGTIIVEFLVDYDGYLASLRKLAGLDVEVLCRGHLGVLVGRREVRQFLEQSIAQTERFKEHVIALLKEEGGAAEPVVKRIKAEMWDVNPGPKLPETPYLINLRTQVEHLAGRFLR